MAHRMRIPGTVVTAVLLAAAGLLHSCGHDPTETGNTVDHGRPLVVVSIPPQEYFVNAVAGDLVDVKVLIPPGASPHTFEPTPSDMEAMESAVVWLTVGVDFEDSWVPRLAGSCPGLRVRSTIDGIERLPMGREGTSGVQPDHGDDGHLGSPDPHVWLSPELVRSQAVSIASALSECCPADSAAFAAGLASFQFEIDSLQESISEILEPVRGRTFMVFHPAWGYFADEFGLVQVAVESGGNDPSPGELAGLVNSARSMGMTTVFVSPQFSASSASVLAAEIGGTTAVLDPMSEDWPGGLLEAAGLIAVGQGGDAR